MICVVVNFVFVHVVLLCFLFLLYFFDFVYKYVTCSIVLLDAAGCADALNYGKLIRGCADALNYGKLNYALKQLHPCKRTLNSMDCF